MTLLINECIQDKNKILINVFLKLAFYGNKIAYSTVTNSSN